MTFPKEIIRGCCPASPGALGKHKNAGFAINRNDLTVVERGRDTETMVESGYQDAADDNHDIQYQHSIDDECCRYNN
ncbi:hypothetical protein TNCT_291481 [Trichonephila clavata]|uniref:Uncharacterized protein n=1 Tax=Trichonephila clavata TaxID=2740835 RepID=A0A8X6EWZ2_TRICU|nr:hypothetical protein TNCT_291481 [Trichonephila clavata]